MTDGKNFTKRIVQSSSTLSALDSWPLQSVSTEIGSCPVSRPSKSSRHGRFRRRAESSHRGSYLTLRITVRKAVLRPENFGLSRFKSIKSSGDEAALIIHFLPSEKLFPTLRWQTFGESVWRSSPFAVVSHFVVIFFQNYSQSKSVNLHFEKSFLTKVLLTAYSIVFETWK